MYPAFTAASAARWARRRLRAMGKGRRKERSSSK